MIARLLTFGSLCLALSACSDQGPAGAEQTAIFDLKPSEAINITMGDSIRLELNTHDSNGQRVILRNPSVRWRVAPAIASVRSNGMLVTLASGETWVAVEVDGVVRDSVQLRVINVSGAFKISLLYAPDVPQRWRDALESGARRWEQAIGGELPAVMANIPVGGCGPIPDEPPSPAINGIERGVIVYVGQSGHFPPGTYTEVVAGPCVQRALPFPTTIFGSVSLNRDKPVSAIPDYRLRHIAVHELGHVLGLVGVVQGKQPTWFDVQTGRYTGAMALEAWRRKFGVTPDAIFSRGGAHWDPMPLADVMISSGLSGEISVVSIGALMDLGYPIRWSGAGPY